MFPTPPLDPGNTEQVYNYYWKKCQSDPANIMLELPPWNDDLHNIMTESPLPTSAFTIEEIEKVIVNLPMEGHLSIAICIQSLYEVPAFKNTTLAG